MKTCQIFVCLLCFIQYSFAQFDYGLGNDEELIKNARLKIVSIYYFMNEYDSVLIHQSSFDSLSGQVSSKIFSSERLVTRSDTFIYDENHFLIKQITFDSSKIRHESNLTNNANGKVLGSRTFGDSINFTSLNIYDGNGRFKKREAPAIPRH